MKKPYSDPLIGKLLAEKGNLCVSIVVPTLPIAPDRDQNRARIKKAVEQAGELLQKIRTKGERQSALLEKVEKRVKEQAAKIDLVHAGEGIGIYVSENVSELMHFHFPVEEKVVVADSFEMRDLLYKENYLSPYFVLVLAADSARLFLGQHAALREVTDKNFPKPFKDDFIYQKPALGSSNGYALKSTEKDKSITKSIRLKEFFREVDAHLTQYLRNDVPLILSGVTKMLSSFLEITAHQKNIVAQISGHYPDELRRSLEEKVWKKMLLHKKNLEQALLRDLENKVSTRQLITGLPEIWKSANEGRGLVLAVEKDFVKAGFQKPESRKILSAPPAQENYKPVPDAVDDVIETVLEKGGNVVFVRNGALKKMQRMALLTRY